MRGVYVGGNERKREGRVYFFRTSFNMFFFKRDQKGGVYVGAVMGKN